MILIIDKHIPIPPVWFKVHAKPWSRFKELNVMEVGDSVAFDNREDNLSAQGYLRTKFGRHAIRSRKEPDGTGWRIWRIA